MAIFRPFPIAQNGSCPLPCFWDAGNLYRSGDAQSGLLAALDIAPKSLGQNNPVNRCQFLSGLAVQPDKRALHRFIDHLANFICGG